MTGSFHMFVITVQLTMVAAPPVARSKVPTSSVMEQRNANKTPFVNILFTFSCLIYKKTEALNVLPHCFTCNTYT